MVVPLQQATQRRFDLAMIIGLAMRRPSTVPFIDILSIQVAKAMDLMDNAVHCPQLHSLIKGS